MTKRLILIGGGVMGRAILGQVIDYHLFGRKQVVVVERNSDRRRILKRELGVVVVADISELTMTAMDVVLLAVKPQDADSVLDGLRSVLNDRCLVVSIMAGATLRSLTKRLHHRCVVRAMPNLAATVGQSMTAWTASAGCTTAHRKMAEKIWQSIGKEFRVASDDILDRVTAISGSGPGYVFSFANDLLAAAEALGFTQQQALLLVRQTLVGSAQLLQQSSNLPDQLVQRVASKGGTTEAALFVLRRAKVSHIWSRAVLAAYRRAHQLSMRI